MMLSKLKYVGLIFFVVVVGGWFRTSDIRMYFFPPKDLYTPLVVGKIDVTKKNKIYSFQFENSYSGKHTIGIVFEKTPENTHYHDYKTDLTLNIEIKNKNTNEILLEKKNIKPLHAYWGGYKRTGGFVYVIYKSPDMLPKKTLLICDVAVDNTDSTFLKLFGKGEFCIRKMSDF